jgi:hypothetical protein
VTLAKRLIKQFVMTALIGFVVHKLMNSSNPRLQTIGRGANRVTRGAFGPDADELAPPKRRVQRAATSAATAAAGASLSYFFDPERGADRRAKVRRVVAQRLHDREPYLLPAASTSSGTPGTVPSQAVAPSVPS